MIVNNCNIHAIRNMPWHCICIMLMYILIDSKLNMHSGKGERLMAQTGKKENTNKLPPQHKAARPHSKPVLKDRDVPEHMNRFTILVLLIISIVAFLPFVAIFFVPLVLAATFATIFYGFYRIIYKRLWHQPVLSAFICCIILIIGMLIPAYVLVQLVVNQAIDLYEQVAPTIRGAFQDDVQYEWLQLIRRLPFGRWLIDQVDWRAIVNSIGSTLTSLGTTILNRTSAGVFGFVANLLITFFILFYFFIDGKRLVSYVKHLLPIRDEYKERIVSNFLLISRATVRGTLIIGLAQGSLGALTLLIFGVDTWIFWGFIMLILSIIPMVGPPIVLIPAGFIQVMKGDIWQGIGIIISSLLVVSSVDNVLRPRVVGSGARMHDLMIFISTLGGLSIFGVMGFIVGPAIASFFVAVVNIYRQEFEPQLGKFDPSG
ncbi:MAG: AI-2E family transporter [Chitinivibrionales bacterium]|nr:AI-2E family transporter [Chitinivibrionales bacterium]